MRFEDFNDMELVAIIRSLSEQMIREKSKIMKEDITRILEEANKELGNRINTYSERLRLLEMKSYPKNL